MWPTKLLIKPNHPRKNQAPSHWLMAKLAQAVTKSLQKTASPYPNVNINPQRYVLLTF